MDGFSGLASAGLGARAAQDAQLDALRAGAQHTSPREAANKFEALFATQLVKEMRKTLGEGFFGEGPQADVYAGWLDQFVGEAIARDGGLHLTRRLEQDLERAQAARTLADETAAAAGSLEPQTNAAPVSNDMPATQTAPQTNTAPLTTEPARTARTTPPTETKS